MLVSKEVIKQAWVQLGYRNKMAEWSLYALFLSGLLLWDIFSLPWFATRWLLIIHVICSLILFPIYVLPFWLSHRRLLKNSKKKFLNVTGQCLDLLLLLCLVSGVFLFIQGNRGDDLGYYTFLSHLISALILTPIIMKHSARWSVLKPAWSLLKSLRVLRK